MWTNSLWLSKFELEKGDLDTCIIIIIALYTHLSSNPYRINLCICLLDQVSPNYACRLSVDQKICLTKVSHSIDYMWRSLWFSVEIAEIFDNDPGFVRTSIKGRQPYEWMKFNEIFAQRGWETLPDLRISFWNISSGKFEFHLLKSGVAPPLQMLYNLTWWEVMTWQQGFFYKSLVASYLIFYESRQAIGSVHIREI